MGAPSSIEPVLHSFRYCLEYLREQVEDVGDEDMSAQPHGIRNHPAWIVGHLASACQLLGRAIGLEPWLPQDWGSRYGTDSVPTHDINGYEPKARALAILDDAHDRFVGAVAVLDDEQLDAPFPVPAYRDVFPTIRHALTQVLVGHTAHHIGQVSVWRRAMGLPPMRRPFE